MHTRVTYTQPELCLVSVYVCGLPFSHNFTPNNRETNPSRKEAKRFVNQNSMRILIANENQYIHTHTCSLEQCQTMTEFPKKKNESHHSGISIFCSIVYHSISILIFYVLGSHVFDSPFSRVLSERDFLIQWKRERERGKERRKKRERERLLFDVTIVAAWFRKAASIRM